MITTVTTVTNLANATVSYGFGIMATLVLIGLLIVKEFSGAAVSSMGDGSERAFFDSLDRRLNAAIIPLLIAFLAIILAKAIAVLH